MSAGMFVKSVRLGKKAGVSARIHLRSIYILKFGGKESITGEEKSISFSLLPAESFREPMVTLQKISKTALMPNSSFSPPFTHKTGNA